MTNAEMASDEDVDDAMYHLLQITFDLSFPHGRYPYYVIAALETAYCTHFRAFMEFVHSGRPTKKGKKPAKPRDTDILLKQYVTEPPVIPWTPEEAARLDDADKLGAHLTMGRAQLRTSELGVRSWGAVEDHSLVLRRIRDVFRLVPDAENRFPSTAILFRYFPTA